MHLTHMAATADRDAVCGRALAEKQKKKSEAECYQRRQEAETLTVRVKQLEERLQEAVRACSAVPIAGSTI
jgi:hypothetical protein